MTKHNENLEIYMKGEMMYANLLKIGIMSVALTGFFAGVAESSFRHYQRKYSESEDLKSGDVQEVVIIEDETKKSGGKK